MIDTSAHILRCLKKNFTSHGLWDPLEKKILPFKYGNSFFALACYLQHNSSKVDIWKAIGEKALEVELRNTKNRFQKIEMFRWEFKNYALLKILEKGELDSDIRKRLRKRILGMQNLGSFKTNWMAMRGLNLLLRGRLLNRKIDVQNSKKEIRRVLERQTTDGFFIDDYNSDSFQYHAYILALLTQYYDLNPSHYLRSRIIKGLEVLDIITDPRGDCGYFGRGQQQVFGYASAVYALSYAHAKLDNNKGYGSLAKLIFSYVNPYLTAGLIVTNNHQNSRAGWYRYNYVTDYLPFSAVYLFMAQEHINFKEIDLPKPKEYEKFLSGSNLFIKRTKEYFVCISAGNKSSSELPGLVHMYPRTIPCSGGPPVNMVGGKSYSYNFMGIGKKNILAKEQGRFARGEDGLHLFFNLSKFKVRYSWSFKKDLRFKVDIYPKEKISIYPLHYVSWKPLDKSLKVGEVLTPQGKAFEYLAEPVTSKDKITKELILYRGEKEPKNISDHPRKKRMRKKFRGQKINHFITLSLDKQIYHPRDFIYSLFYMYMRNNYKRKKVIF